MKVTLQSTLTTYHLTCLVPHRGYNMYNTVCKLTILEPWTVGSVPDKVILSPVTLCTMSMLDKCVELMLV